PAKLRSRTPFAQQFVPVHTRGNHHSFVGPAPGPGLIHSGSSQPSPPVDNLLGSRPELFPTELPTGRRLAPDPVCDEDEMMFPPQSPKLFKPLVRLAAEL